MRHVHLGRTGRQVSRLCLGSMTSGLQCDEPASVPILDGAAAGVVSARPWDCGASPKHILDADARSEARGPAAALKARLDEMTWGYRYGDDPR